MSARSGKTYRSGRAAIAGWALLAVLLLSFLVLAQSGRNPVSGRRSSVINIIGRRSEDPNRPKRLLSPAEEEQAAQERIIPREVVSLFDAGVPQRIESFSPDPTPARYVVLMDNSSTLQADVRKLATVPAAFAPEIYEGDKVMVIGYDQKPEIITDFTDEPDKLQGTLELLRKSDTPRLYDALNVVLEDVLRPEVGFSKRIVLIVGDGLDRGSVIRFEEILAKLQNENITIYAVQVRDRTRGALRKDQPKPVEVLRQLTSGTGGRIYPIDGDTKAAIKEVCDEIRNDRYLLSYYPEGVNPINKRLILLSSTDPTVTFHYKGWHPPAKF